jgi:hypothetical protein
VTVFGIRWYLALAIVLTFMGFSIARQDWDLVAVWALLLVAPPVAAFWYRRTQESV